MERRPRPPEEFQDVPEIVLQEASINITEAPGPSRRLSGPSPSTGAIRKQAIPQIAGETRKLKKPSQLRRPSQLREPSVRPQTTTPAPTSIMEWFDKSVESELEKRRIDPTLATMPKSRISRLPLGSGLGNQRVVESVPDAVEMVGNLQGDIHTDLTQAVEKFAKAEAIVAFEGAVKAAEAAAASAPPEFAEEAAVAGAKGYQAELTSVVRQQVAGSRPIEVIGYVGITRATGAPIKRNY